MQTISILVADDDPIIRQCLRHAMEADPQLRVQWEACNGLQALALANQHHPDLIILDAQMPRMDGIETTRCLRQRAIKSGIVIISVFDNIRSQALEAGADAFIVKDCGCDTLRAVMRRVLNENSGQTSGQETSEEDPERPHPAVHAVNG